MPSSSEHEQLSNPVHPACLDRPGDSATPADLDATRRDFPAFRIWSEAVGDRIVYVARRRQPGTRPHTLVTTDLHELRAVLADTAGHAAHPERPSISCPPPSAELTR